MHSLFLAYALVGGLSLLIALGSTKIRRLPVSEPLLALLVGVLVGPALLGLMEIPEELRVPLFLELSRALLAISLMAIALRYPVRPLLRLTTPLTLLIVVVLPGMMAITAGLAWAIAGLPLALALVLGMCLSPTDPVLASSVATGKPAEEGIPSRTRELLSMESGANDGLAYVGVLLALSTVVATSLPEAAGKAAYGVAAGIVLGAVVGWVSGKVLKAADDREDVDSGSILVFTLILAVATLGAARLIDADGVLAVFVAGLVYNWVADPHEREQEERMDEALNRYLVLPIFLVLGVALPWQEWAGLGWAAAGFVLAVMLLRRLPLLLLLRRPLGLAWRDSVFLGWFGPIGVSALFYLAHVEHEGAGDPRLWALGTLVVTASTVAHGLSSAGGRRLYELAAQRAGAAS